MEGFHDSKVCPSGFAGEICRYIENIGMDVSMIFERFGHDHSYQEIRDTLNQLVATGQVERTDSSNRAYGTEFYRWWTHQVDDHGRTLY